MEGDFEFEASPESRIFLENLKRIHSTKEASIKSASSDDFQEAAENVTSEPEVGNLIDDFGNLKIFNSHSVTLDDSGRELGHRAVAEPTKWKYGLDHATWLEKKKKLETKKKIRFVLFIRKLGLKL